MNKPIELKPENTDVRAALGDKISYSFYEHISVGFWAEFEIEDEDVIRHSGTNTTYDTPERMKEPGLTGADAARTSFFFEAIAVGTSMLIFRNIFRGNIETEYRFRITIS